MRILDAERGQPITAAQLYLTEREARELRDALGELLAAPEATEHRHVLDGAVDLSVSIVTQRKLDNTAGYTAAERKLLGIK
jgi:hypothetical protein